MNIKLKPIVSFTTRPMRDNEINGREHFFISPEEAKEHLENDHILAYTKIGDIEYFASKEYLNGANLYIIDPNGVEWFKKNNPDIPVKIIYIFTPKEIIIERVKNRSDFISSFVKRNQAEDEQFTYFENNKNWDYLIENYDFDKSVEKFINILKENNDNPDILYLVVGRSGSGKDSIITETINRLK